MTAKTAPPVALLSAPSADGPTAPDAAKELAREAGDIARRTAEQIARVVVGAEAVTEQLLTAMLAGGHVLLEGVPGVAKTTLSKVFSKLLGCKYQRSPDGNRPRPCPD